jgi:hypothetical protein
MNDSLLADINRQLKALKQGQVIRLGLFFFALSILSIVLQIVVPEWMDALAFSFLFIPLFWIAGMITVFIGFIVLMNRSKKARTIIVESLYAPLFNSIASQAGSRYTLLSSTALMDPPWFVSRPQQANVVFTIGERGQPPLLQAVEIVYTRSTGTRSASYIEFSGYILTKPTSVDNFSYFPEQNVFGIKKSVDATSLATLPAPLPTILSEYGAPYPIVHAQVLDQRIELALSMFPLVRLKRRYKANDVSRIENDLRRLLQLITRFDDQF